MYDYIMVGGGLAGLAAAAYLGRSLRSALINDAGAGQATSIPTTHNLIGFPDGVSGADLLIRMRQHATRYGAGLAEGCVTGIFEAQTRFVVVTAVETIRRTRGENAKINVGVGLTLT